MTLREQILLATAILEAILMSPILYGIWQHRRNQRRR